MATIVRFTRAGVLDAINSNYVLYERAMGFPHRVIVWKYVLRNALIGTVTQIGLIIGIPIRLTNRAPDDRWRSYPANQPLFDVVLKEPGSGASTQTTKGTIVGEMPLDKLFLMANLMT